MDENMNQNNQPSEEFRDEAYREAFGQGEELEQLFREEPEAQPVQRTTKKPVKKTGKKPGKKPAKKSKAAPQDSERKGRPARKKGYGLLGIPHILATVVWIAIVVAIGVSLGRVAWVCASDVLAFGRENQEVMVTIQETDTLEDIANMLQENGLVRYPGLFKFYGSLTDAREKISAGTFTLNTIYDYMALVNSMSKHSSNREVVKVTIPEGYTCQQIFELLEEKGVCKAEYLAEYAANGELDNYWFLEGVERGTANCLEGFLFPDTYQFYTNSDAEYTLEKLLDGFDYRFSDEHIAAIDVLNERLAEMMRKSGYGEEYIAANKYDIRKVVIVASLIEKETANTDESFTISSVIYNRLTNQAEYPFLNIDAALLYAIGHKDVITAVDKQADTPYNTYLYKGLVPGPISNPGLNSLNAALNPDDTNYHYYALDSANRAHVFSKNYDDHLKVLDKLGY